LASAAVQSPGAEEKEKKRRRHKLIGRPSARQKMAAVKKSGRKKKRGRGKREKKEEEKPAQPSKRPSIKAPGKLWISLKSSTTNECKGKKKEGRKSRQVLTLRNSPPANVDMEKKKGKGKKKKKATSQPGKKIPRPRHCRTSSIDDRKKEGEGNATEFYEKELGDAAEKSASDFLARRIRAQRKRRREGGRFREVLTRAKARSIAVRVIRVKEREKRERGRGGRGAFPSTIKKARVLNIANATRRREDGRSSKRRRKGSLRQGEELLVSHGLGEKRSSLIAIHAHEWKKKEGEEKKRGKILHRIREDWRAVPLFHHRYRRPKGEGKKKEDRGQCRDRQFASNVAAGSALYLRRANAR